MRPGTGPEALLRGKRFGSGRFSRPRNIPRATVRNGLPHTLSRRAKQQQTCLHARLRRAKRAEAPVLSSRKRQSDTASGEKPATAGRKGISEVAPFFRTPSLLSDRSIRRRTAGAKPAAMKPSGIPKKTDPPAAAAPAPAAPHAPTPNRATLVWGRPVSSPPTRRIYFPAIRSKYFLKKRI